MKFKINNKNIYLFLALLSVSTLVSAIFIEYVLGYKPCKLCLYQRYPYVISLLLCIIGYKFFNSNVWIYLLCFTFFTSFILSGYHTGIEYSIFPEFSGCKVDDIDFTNKDELLNLLKQYVPNCKDVSFRIFGLSLATINMFISLFIIIIFIIKIKHEKNK